MFCCDYDALTTYEPGSFCSQHRTDLTGRIERVNLNAITDMDDLNSFLNQSYESYITTAPLILYRAFGAVKKDSGKIAGAWATGRFISTEFAESMIDVKNRLALAPEWFNTKMYEEKLLVPAGTEFYLGIVAPVKMKSGTILSGGAQQILLTERSWLPTHYVQTNHACAKIQIGRYSGRGREKRPISRNLSGMWFSKYCDTQRERAILHPRLQRKYLYDEAPLLGRGL